jgi:plasmid stabilization system protein ParE
MDTRELSVTGLPYIIVYEVDDRNHMVAIVRIIHGAQRWPPPGLQ